MRLDNRPDERLERLRSEYLQDLGPRAARRREAEIAALPSKVWRGRRVFAIRCNADFGRGPHTMWLEEAWLWALIDLKRFRCPFHR